MKKVFALILAACMVFSMGAVAQAEGVSGEFTGTAQGLGGDVNVTLTLEDGKITGCTADGANETVGIGSVVIDTFPAVVVESGSIAVDAISGATITSDAFVAAAAAALTAAGLNPDDYKTAIEGAAAEDRTMDADLVIVGAGGAGMTAGGEPGHGGRQLRPLHRRHERCQDPPAGQEHLRRGSRR